MTTLLLKAFAFLLDFILIIALLSGDSSFTSAAPGFTSVQSGNDLWKETSAPVNITDLANFQYLMPNNFQHLTNDAAGVITFGSNRIFYDKYSTINGIMGTQIDHINNSYTLPNTTENIRFGPVTVAEGNIYIHVLPSPSQAKSAPHSPSQAKSPQLSPSQAKSPQLSPSQIQSPSHAKSAPQSPSQAKSRHQTPSQTKSSQQSQLQSQLQSLLQSLSQLSSSSPSSGCPYPKPLWICAICFVISHIMRHFE